MNIDSSWRSLPQRTEEQDKIDKLMAEFKARGGEIQKVPPGYSLPRAELIDLWNSKKTPPANMKDALPRKSNKIPISF